MTAQDTHRAIDAAWSAQKEWAARSVKERAAVLKRLHEMMLSGIDDLATILTTQMGKPFAEAQGEILYGASYVERFAEEAKRINGDLLPGHQRDKRILVMKQPVGV